MSSNTRERFVAWLRSTGWSPMEAGFRIGCDRAYVGRIASGAHVPGLKIAAAIERLTEKIEGGPIRCVDWEKTELHQGPAPMPKKRGRPPKHAAPSPSSPPAPVERAVA